jgi:hypothetical protein
VVSGSEAHLGRHFERELFSSHPGVWVIVVASLQGPCIWKILGNMRVVLLALLGEYNRKI